MFELNKMNEWMKWYEQIHKNRMIKIMIIIYNKLVSQNDNSWSFGKLQWFLLILIDGGMNFTNIFNLIIYNVYPPKSDIFGARNIIISGRIKVSIIRYKYTDLS